MNPEAPPANVPATIEPQRARAATIKDLLKGDDLKRAIAAALPKHMSPDRFIRVALTATMRNPDLLMCTQTSFFRCLLDLSAYGLEPDGRRAHLIPFKNNKTRVLECTLIIDYKGLADLVRRSGDVSYIHADAVYVEDTFDYAYGSGAFLNHKPSLHQRTGLPVAFYSFVRLKDGAEDFLVMSKPDVDKIRKRSRAADAGPWVTDYDEMGKKTAFRRHSKWLPLSPEVRAATEYEDPTLDVDGALGVLGTTAETPDELPAPAGKGLRDIVMGQPSFLDAPPAEETKTEEV
jgi:recombination protein RecT